MLEPNTDPHEYEPRPSDVAATAAAKLVFANGDGLDDWIDEVVSDSGSDAEVVDLGAVVPDRLRGGPGDAEASGEDPHWWHDPRNAAAAVREIERRLAAADPARRRLFERNAGAYLARLRALDRRIARCVAAVPAARRKLVTDHDAFGYFARRYGIDVVGAVIPSQTTQAQPSAKDLAELARTIEAERVTAIFPESSLSARVAEAIARQTGASAARALYGDSLGPEGSAGATYLGMEAANADAMVARLHRREARMRAAPLSAAPGAPLIEAEGLAVGYGDGEAISGVAFSLRAGERMALLGPNGGGKTTLLRALLGELQAAARRAPRRRPLRDRAADRALPPRLPGLRPRRRRDGGALAAALVAAPRPRRPRARPRGAGPGRPRPARRRDLRRALRRPAPARPDRPRPRPGRPRAAPRRALLRPRPPRLRAARIA